ncbi:MAG: hypothetical protein FWF20_04725 [Betaproteobacteria bacterium]|nr:hypothetical protein [Betaproteobacteria bacterium]MCL2886082.1 hypothetical protein [Betaproteobacteria bacterium]
MQARHRRAFFLAVPMILYFFAVSNLADIKAPPDNSGIASPRQTIFERGKNDEWRVHQIDGAEHFLRGNGIFLPPVLGAVIRYPFATAKAGHAGQH